MSDAEIVYRSGVVFFGNRSRMPSWAEDRLRGYMDDAGVESLLISSGYRAPEDQARIMYDNLVGTGTGQGLAAQRALYSSLPNRVIDVFVANQGQGASRADIIAAMADKIREIGPEHISRHMAEDATVFDIAPSSMSAASRAALLARLQQVPNNKNWRTAQSVPDIGELLWPPTDPAFHVEFPTASAPADADLDEASGGIGVADVIVGGAVVGGAILAARKFMKKGR